MRIFGFLALFLYVTASFGQDKDVAKKIYESSQDSVFLVYLNDSTGAPTALGSAFLVAPKLLVTNAHVVEAGSPVLAVGPVRIPVKVLRIDKVNDLALLSVEIDLTSKPLLLSTASISPGEQIFAIGNPAGLEKSISQGIVSGLRKIGERNLLQITSPISHGSSGGPILNYNAEVVGVAVGMLEDGQNLNFAVPVEYVRKLITQNNSNNFSIFDITSATSQFNVLADTLKAAQYSEEPSSEYQQTAQNIMQLTDNILANTTQEEILTKIACLGKNYYFMSDRGIEAARNNSKYRPTPANRAFLSYILYKRAQIENFRASYAERNSDDEKTALESHEKYLMQAWNEAIEGAKIAKGDALSLANFVIASVKNDRGEYVEAALIHNTIANIKLEVCGDEIQSQVLKDLISENYNAKRNDEAEKWFRRFADLYTPTSYQWDAEGDRRHSVNDYERSAEAYENAAQNDSDYSYDYCYAANDFYMQKTTNVDAVLENGRKCIEASVRNTDKNNEKQFNHALPSVYGYLAAVLEQRGVYPAALENIKQAISLAPNSAFNLITEAQIYQDTSKFTECTTAAQAAIRASDGKYPYMQEVLAECYFSLEDWSQAEIYFKLAAEGDRSDASAAFNLGLTYARQGYSSDAKIWFTEALNRHPDEQLKEKILNALR